MSDHFRIEERASQPTLTVRDQVAHAELPNLFDRAFGSIIERLSELGEEPTGPAFAYYHSLDMEHPDLEVGFPVARTLEDSGEIKSSALPGGVYCSTLYTGSYDGLPEAWAQTIAYATEQGHGLDEFAIEFYITNPAEVAPDQNQTEIVLPLKSGTRD